jgi:hypothetical protein
MNKLFIPIIILTVLCIAPNKSKADLIGNFNSGASQVSSTRQICATTTAPSTGTVNSISYIASSTVASLIGVALYGDNGSSRPGTLIASNAPSGVTPPSTKAWATTTLSAPIISGYIYWMCIWANNTYNYYQDTTTGFNQAAGDTSASWETWASTFNTNSFVTSRQLAIYMSYTPSVPSTIRYYMDTGLSVYQRFDTKDRINGLALDVSGNFCNGTMENIASSTFYKSGRIGQSFNFDGVNDAVSITPVANCAARTSGTVSAWINSSLANSQQAIVTSSSQSDTTHEWRFSINNTGCGFNCVTIVENNGGSYKCEVKQAFSDMENSGTVYIAGGNIRGEYTTIAEGRTIDTSFIMKDGYSYTWSSALANIGFKTKINTKASGAGAESSGTYSWNASQIGDYNCEPWTADEKTFETPAGMSFKEV